MKKTYHYLTHYREEAIRLLAITRLLLREKTRKSFLFGFHMSEKYKKNFDKRVIQELIDVNREVEEDEKKHLEDLKKIKKSYISEKNELSKTKDDKNQ